MSTVEAAPDIFRVIRLDLAREAAHPEGSTQDRYILMLPLDDGGRIDVSYCRDFPDLCRVAHADSDGGVHRGLIRREADGTWAFDYGDADEATETGFRFGQEQFTPGEYVSVVRNGQPHPYRVVSLQPL
ncbi:MAG: hypothetical protein WDN45_15680 [Caulobacteraceae bacterium]